MSPNEPLLDRFDRLLRLGEHLLAALARAETPARRNLPIDEEWWL